MQYTIALVDDNEMILKFIERYLSDYYKIKTFSSGKQVVDELKAGWTPDLIVTDLSMPDVDGFSLLNFLQNDSKLAAMPVIVLSGQEQTSVRVGCLRAGARDFMVKPFHPEELRLRIQKCLLPTPPKSEQKQEISSPLRTQETSLRKRALDIVVSAALLILLSPLMLLVAILIRLDSRGPIVYSSRRVGEGYRVFKLYKFRTMRTDADQQLATLQHLNMYNGASANKQTSAAAVFLKLKDDPRITRIGRLLRNTSIDELPQLFNILKGDMSLVGNRPLPLYEAEKLTTDESAARFMAPAGLTGLWQVTRRGKGDLSARERIELDNTYAFRHSFWFDVKLMVRTIPALFQTETM